MDNCSVTLTICRHHILWVPCYMHPKCNYTFTNYNKWSLYVVSMMLHASEALGTFPRKKEGGILPSWMGGVAFDESMGEKIRGNSASTKTEREVFWKTIRGGLVRIGTETFCYLYCHSQLQFISHGNLYKKTNYGDFNRLTKRGLRLDMIG